MVSDEEDDEYDGGYNEPVIVTASDDHHVDAFGDADDVYADDMPHIGIVHDNGDGLCLLRCLLSFLLYTILLTSGHIVPRNSLFVTGLISS